MIGNKHELRQSDPNYFISRWKLALEQQDTRIRNSSDRLHRQIDLDIYVLVLRNLVRAVNYAEDITKSDAIRTAREAFESTIPSWKNVRDILEHFDEYAEGGGRLQLQGRATVIGPYYAEEETRDLNGVLVARNYYLSFGEGNQLDILTTTKAATMLANSALERLQA